MPTFHISAAPEQIAKTVLMPGDPLRARFVAETYLEKPELVNNIRGIQGYTGTYRGKPVTVMASGMGAPSMSIYSHELYEDYHVENIIRIGSAARINKELPLRSVVAAMSAYADSAVGDYLGFTGHMAPCASWQLLKKADAAAKALSVPLHVGSVFSSDTFYDDNARIPVMRRLHVLALEMETYALYFNAALAGRNALALLTISNDIETGESCTPQEVRETFTDMMEIALELAE